MMFDSIRARLPTAFTVIEPPFAGNLPFTVGIANALGGAQAIPVIDPSVSGRWQLRFRRAERSRAKQYRFLVSVTVRFRFQFRTTQTPSDIHFSDAGMLRILPPQTDLQFHKCFNLQFSATPFPISNLLNSQNQSEILERG